MDQVTKVRKSIKLEQWKTLIKECQSSGMTVSAWCNLNNSNYQNSILSICKRQ